MNRKNINTYLLAIIMLILGSCVGEVQSEDPELAQNATVTGVSESFGGLVKVVPISDSKVELFWFGASGNPSDIMYLIYVDNSENPYKVKAESLIVQPNGLYRYTLTNLDIDTSYNFRVSVENSETGSISKNDKEIAAKTFGNRTASFNGISQVRLADGEAGRTSVIVDWAKAYTVGLNVARPTDPVQYEIRYIAASEGGPSELLVDDNPKVSIVREPTTVTTNAMPSKAQTKTVVGLVSGEKYYFLVRCIHSNYLKHGEDLEYLSEKNGSYLSITTRSNNDLFDFIPSKFDVASTNGELGLTAFDLSWEPASGDYSHYRVFYNKVGEPGDDQTAIEATADSLGAANITALNGNSSNYIHIDAGVQAYRLKNLESYAYYHMKVVACKNVTCTEDQRIPSDLVLKRVVPKRAPFNGVISIENPTSTATLDEVILEFDPPVMSYGYANKVKVYCFSDEDDTEPVELVNGTNAVSAKPNCNGLSLGSVLPTTTNSLAGLSEVTVKGIQFPSNAIASDKKYCFSVMPIIESAFLPADNRLGIVKCKIPEIRVPSNIDFPGRNRVCSQSAIDTLSISWTPPTNGVYTNYQVFWKEKDGMPFRFEEAVSGGNASYLSADLPNTATTYDIANLIPGRDYQIGVLSYISVDGNRKYSQFNSNTSPCQLPKPVTSFSEWVDVFAVGPKVDGRVPIDDFGNSQYILETLDRDLLPIEVDVNPVTSNPTTDFTNRFGNRSGSQLFQGVYGSLDANSSAVKHQYSNSGIVRIVWKDFNIVDSSLEYQNIIAMFEDGSAVKKDRKFGYKVLRSEDGRRNWVDLTSVTYSYQSTNNAGLLVPFSRVERVRNNVAATTYNAVSFTDYSVQKFGNSGEDTRARVYYYKIVPVFDGIPLDVENIEQTIIKVILPPPNMALVNRIIANRSMCLEVGKTPILDVKQYYSCFYNGLGARGLTTPWSTTQSVLDAGGDLLVDRFEMGCNYTRGDITNQNSTYSGANVDFIGASDNSQPFVGCSVQDVGGTSHRSDSWIDGVNTPGAGVPYSSYKQIIRGDCIGQDTMQFDSYTSATDATCSDSSKIPNISYNFPGARGVANCSISSEQHYDNFLEPYNENSSYNASMERVAAQSEFGAVYYLRHNSSGVTGYTYSPSKFRAAGGNSVSAIHLETKRNYRPGGCFINLPTADNTIDPIVGQGRFKPRWMPTRDLGEVDYKNDLVTFSTLNVLTDTIGNIISGGAFFDGDQNSLPPITTNRFQPTTPVARIFSSNNSKLPPLSGFRQDEANDVCSTYKVEVGYSNVDGSFKSVESAKDKHLMRKKEIISSSAWPSTYDETTVTNLEDGTSLEPSDDGGVSNNSACNGYNKNVSGVGAMAAGDELRPEFAGNGARPRLLTGSSFYDSIIGNNDTQKCQSRYGIQDLVGNNGEISSEAFFCNFGGDILYIGAAGDSLNSLVAPSSSYYNETNVTPWVWSDPDTGRCSAVEIGSLRSGNYLTGIFMNPSFLNGVVNTNVLSQTKSFDVEGVDDVRSGDGFFLDYGQTNFGAPISFNDTIALKFDQTVKNRSSRGATTDPRRSKYFNPVLGMPLECGGSVCTSSFDNMTISTDEFVTAFSQTAASFVVSDFPTNNSQILSDGISEIKRNRSYTLPSDSLASVDYIDSVDTGTGVINRIQNVISSIIGSFEIWWYDWRVYRGSNLLMSNGGNSTTETSGRYSMNLRDERNYWSIENSGFRCAIRVGEND